MIIKSIQNKNILEKLSAGNTHFAKDTDIENLVKPYRTMINHYHWTTTPVFGCVVGRKCEFYGANTNDAVILTLDVPDELVKLQAYYDWVDIIYYTECPDEWEYSNFDEFMADVLNGVKTDDPNTSIISFFLGLTFSSITSVYTSLSAAASINSPSIFKYGDFIGVNNTKNNAR